MCRINQAGDTTPAEWFSSSYVFQMFNDSACVTEYTICEFRRNGGRIPLRNWKFRRTTNAHADILGFNSRTVDVALATDDTLSFYRQLFWSDPLTNVQRADGYLSTDRLTYSIELVRTSDSLRIALLDSIGIQPCPAMCVPTIHGSRPIMALVKFPVPASLDGTSAFMRVRVWSEGTGSYYFTRKENVVAGLSLRLLDSYWIDYLSLWNQLSKRVTPTPDMVAENGVELHMQANAGTPRDVTMHFTAPETGPTMLAIYDALGRALFYPFSSPEFSGSGTTTYHFEQPGLYIAALLQNGRIIATRKIIITQ